MRRWSWLGACGIALIGASCSGDGTQTDQPDTAVTRGPVVFTTSPPTTASRLVEYSYEARASQEGGDGAFRYAVAKGPAGLTIGGNTGSVRWIPGEGQVGSHEVTLVATASDGQTGSQSFAIAVESAIVSSFAPAAASSRGGETVTVRGTGFKSDSIVRIGGKEVSAKSTNDSVEFVTPPHVAGRVSLEIVRGASVVSVQPGFTYIPELSIPDTAALAIGANLTLNAIGFEPSMLSADVLSMPSFGGTSRRMIANGATGSSLTFATGVASGEANPRSGAATLLVNGIRSNCVPVLVRDVAPTLAVTGTSAGSDSTRLQIQGTGFGGLTGYDGTGAFDLDAPTSLLVMFSGTKKPARVRSIASAGTSVEVDIPSEAVTGPIAVYAPGRAPATSCVIATLPGTAPVLAAIGFTPEGGPPSTPVVILGSGFPSDPTKLKVRFDGKNARVLSLEPTRLVVETPSELRMGAASMVISAGDTTVVAGTFAVSGSFKTIAGGGLPSASPGDGGPPKAASAAPAFIATDDAGYLVADGRRLRLANTSSAPVTAFGRTVAPGIVDTVVNIEALTEHSVGAFAVQPGTGDVFFAAGPRLYRATRTDGKVAAWAGTNVEGFSGDGGERLSATFGGITDLRFTTGTGRSGSLLVVADNTSGWVRAVNATDSSITLWGVTVPANGVQSIEKTGTANPMGVALDPQDNIIVTRYHTVLRIPTDRATRPASPPPDYVAFSTIAGDGSSDVVASGCPPTAIGLGVNNGVALDPVRGHLYVGSRHGLIRRISKNASGVDCVDFVAGRGDGGVAEIGYSGDGGPARSAAIGLFARPFVDRDGSLLIMGDGRVRRVQFNSDATRTPGNIETIIGKGPRLPAKDSSALNLRGIDGPAGVVVDSKNGRYLYVNGGAILAHDKATDTVAVVGGNGIFGNFIGSTATSSSIGLARGMALYADELIILEALLPRVSAVNTIENKYRWLIGDGIAATAADRQKAAPFSASRVSIGTGSPRIALPGNGTIFFADEERVRIMNPTSAPITTFGVTVAPQSVATLPGEFGNNIAGLAFDKKGSLWVTTLGNQLLVKRNSEGFAVAAIVTPDPERVGFPAPTTLGGLRLNAATELAFNSRGDLLIANSQGHCLLLVQADDLGSIGPESRVVPVFGNGASGGPTPAGNAVTAVGAPSAVALDGNRILAVVSGNVIAIDAP